MLWCANRPTTKYGMARGVLFSLSCSKGCGAENQLPLLEILAYVATGVDMGRHDGAPNRTVNRCGWLRGQPYT